MNSIILFSGGIDSSLCLSLYKKETPTALGIDYGQPHVIELDYAKAIAETMGVRFIRLTLPALFKTDDVVFAGRNAILISSAINEAWRAKARTIVIGCNKTDAERFPDCRPEFIMAMNHALSAYGMRLEAPLLEYTKAEIKDMAQEQGIDLALTWSCYAPQKGRPCGSCLACKVRG